MWLFKLMWKILSIPWKIWEWFDDRSEISKTLGPLLRHPIPPGTGWKYVFGSATLIALLIQVATGIALATAYVSSAGGAYKSLEFISHQATWGWWVRGMHYFGASAMILLVGLHMGRVFLTGSYKFPRELNWITGVVLLALTLAMGFTGQLLRWDQDGVWSTAIAAEQAGRVPVIGHWIARLIFGGNTVGGSTLSRFFAVHVFWIPAIIFGVVGFHLYLVVRNGISEPAKPGHPINPKTYRAWYKELLHRSGRPFFPDAAWRDVVFGFMVVVAIVVLAGIVHAPELAGPPNPTIIQAEPRPDWYLLWYYAVLALTPHYLESYLMILVPIIGGVLLILLPLIFNRGERSVSRRPWSAAIAIFVVLCVATMWYQGKAAHWSPAFQAAPLALRTIGASSGPVYQGAQLFHERGCEDCHAVGGQGGHRGPDLSTVADRLTEEQMTVRILNGGNNMPAFGSILTPRDLSLLLDFLDSRTAYKKTALARTGGQH
jgi:ubiquinol-cytochrome c reductase cytochrome b subunit